MESREELWLYWSLPEEGKVKKSCDKLKYKKPQAAQELGISFDGRCSWSKVMSSWNWTSLIVPVPRDTCQLKAKRRGIIIKSEKVGVGRSEECLCYFLSRKCIGTEKNLPKTTNKNQMERMVKCRRSVFQISPLILWIAIISACRLISLTTGAPCVLCQNVVIGK